MLIDIRNYIFHSNGIPVPHGDSPNLPGSGPLRLIQEKSGPDVGQLLGQQRLTYGPSLCKGLINGCHLIQHRIIIDKRKNITQIRHRQIVIRPGHLPVKMTPDALPSRV